MEFKAFIQCVIFIKLHYMLAIQSKNMNKAKQTNDHVHALN